MLGCTYFPALDTCFMLNCFIIVVCCFFFLFLFFVCMGMSLFAVYVYLAYFPASEALLFVTSWLMLVVFSAASVVVHFDL